MPELPRGLAGWLARRLPREARERWFLPTFHEIHAEYVRACHRACRAARAVRRLILPLQIVSAAFECHVRALAEARRERSRPRLPDPRHSGGRSMLLQDLRFAIRLLRKNPAFTIVSAAALALGIGANTAIFSVVHAVLLRPLPYGAPAAIVEINETMRGRPQTVSPPNFLDWKAQNRTLASIAAYQDGTMTLEGGEAPDRMDAAFVGADLFGVLGVAPLLGRGFLPEEERPGGPLVVVLGHSLWQSRFGGAENIVGRSLRFDGRDHQVVGVMPRGVTFPGDIGVWFPLVLTDRDTNQGQRGAHYLNVVARLKPGVTVAQANDDLATIERAIAARYPSVQGYGVWVQPLLDAVVGDVRLPLVMLSAAVGCVLLIACANVSNLLLARAAGRRAEVAVRSALGASRRRIVRQLLAESLVLSLVGGVLGVLLAAWGVRVLAATVPEDLPRATNISVNVTVLTFSLIVTIAAGFVFGVVPAVYASTPDLSAFLKDARRDGGSIPGRRRFARALVAIEVALALMLLAGAGLAIRSFDRLNRVDPGFDPTNVLAVNVALPDARYPEADAMGRFFRSFVDALAAQPGAVAAGAVMRPPLSPHSFGGTFSIIGRAEGDDQRMQVRPATHGYFEALRIPVARGRVFTAADDGASAHVAILSEEAARRFWPGEDPIGRRIRIHVALGARERDREIVGVVGDVKLRSLQSPPAAVVYVPYAQYVADQMTVFVRTKGDPLAFAPVVRAELARIDRDVAPTNIRPAREMVASSVAEMRFRTTMLSLFAGMALALAAIGLYGVMAYAVGQRRNELGLRMALGADTGDVLRLVLGDGLIPVAAGIAVGLLCAGALTRVMSTLAIGISPLDPLTFTAVPILLACVACAACYIPARRATKVDPVTALRHD